MLLRMVPRCSHALCDTYPKPVVTSCREIWPPTQFMSPVMADKRALFPAPTFPVMQTKSPRFCGVDD